MNPNSIAVIGLGLMGGSLAAASRKKFPKAKILGVSRSSKALSLAKRRGWIHQSSRKVADAAECDLAVLCTPVNAFEEALSILELRAERPLLVTDVGSVKGEITRFTDSRRWKNVRYVGAHPMVGSHRQGMNAADPELYDNALIFITPGKRKQARAVREISGFWRSISPRIVKTTPEKHDQVVSEVSHLPHVLALCLMLAVDRKNMKFAGGGFRDVTRIAASHPSIWIPIFLSNRPAILRDLKHYENILKSFRRMLTSKDEVSLRKALIKSSDLRSEI